MSPIRNLFRKFRSAGGADGADAPAAQSPFRWVIAGLGNPGEDYAASRHNFGFRVADRLAKSRRAEFSRRKFKGLIAETEIAGNPVLLVKPQTYYNLSGECVSSLLNYYKIPPANLIVVHDELDLEAGRLRLKRGGSDAGTRGVRSIAQALGTPDFVRIRIGIGRPPQGEDAKERVLGAPSAEERGFLEQVAERAAQAVEAVIGEGLDRAMGRFNQRV